MKTTVIHHSADFDGLFCRAIACKFLPDAELIGWDFGDEPLPLPDRDNAKIYVLDLPVDRVFGFDFTKIETVVERFGINGCMRLSNFVWIDHHASSIATHPQEFPGYRIDGVAACRLAWQWFSNIEKKKDEDDASKWPSLPVKQDFVDRAVFEPLAVRLAGEYDIWDKRDPHAELFQFALRSREVDFQRLLRNTADSIEYISILGEGGKVLQYTRAQEYRDVITQQGFDVQWEGLCFLACNSHELDIRSHLFEAGIQPRHDGLIGFTFSGRDWRVSLYGVPGKPDIDFSKVAVKYGGGGHKQACGFRAAKLPFIEP